MRRDEHTPHHHAPAQPPNTLLPLVALVGRPNVGKSTMFNRLIGQQRSIVEDLPGTTRDRIYGETDWNGRPFSMVDTGGLEIAPTGDISVRVRNQAELAVEEADVIVFMVDALQGIVPQDFEIAEMLRRSNKPVLLAANKADNPKRRFDAVEFYSLGLEEPIVCSALQGIGTGDLLDEIINSLPAPVEIPEAGEPGVPRIAIVGRPNVGKSSLLNAYAGEQRVIVSPIPGTTRDSIDVEVAYRGKKAIFVDTAGIRRRGKVLPGIEAYSVLRSIRAISRADIALLVLDAVEGLTEQDTHIAGAIERAGKGVLILVNKWDLIPDKTEETTKDYTTAIRAGLRFLDYAPIIFTSALTKQRLERVLRMAPDIMYQRAKRLPTAELNTWLRGLLFRTPPPAQNGKRVHISYVTQAETEPPTFVFFVNDYHLLHWSYHRFLENELRAMFSFDGTPIRLRFRNKSENASP